MLKRLIRDVPDFPQPGVVFKDITPLLADHDGFARGGRRAGGDRSRRRRDVVDKVVGIEARGFILAAPVALALGRRLRAGAQGGQAARGDVRGVLRAGVRRGDHRGAPRTPSQPGDRVLVIDDVLATGGTVEATVELVGAARRGGHGVAVLIELGFLHGRERLGRRHRCTRSLTV